MNDERLEALRSGKERVAAAIVWQFESGLFRLRCVKRAPGSYVVQIRGSAWEPIVSGTDPNALLASALASSTARLWIQRRVDAAVAAPEIVR